MAISFEVYRPVIRLMVGLIILAIINWVLTNLPMVKAVSIPGSPVSITAIVSVVVGIIMISLLLVFGKEFAPRLQAALPTVPEIGTVVSATIALAVVTIAYTMFKAAIIPFMQELLWLYHLTFLIIAIWPLTTLITALYKSSNKIADLASVKIAETSGELIKCTSCGAYISSSATFCPRCSCAVNHYLPVSETVICSNCDTANISENIYCLGCGKPLVSKDTALINKNDKPNTVQWS